MRRLLKEKPMIIYRILYKYYDSLLPKKIEKFPAYPVDDHWF